MDLFLLKESTVIEEKPISESKPVVFKFTVTSSHYAEGILYPDWKLMGCFQDISDSGKGEDLIYHQIFYPF